MEFNSHFPQVLQQITQWVTAELYKFQQMITVHMTNRKQTIFNLALQLPNVLTVYLKSDAAGVMTAWSLQGLNYGKNEQRFFLLNNIKTNPEADTVSYQSVLGGYSHSPHLEATLIMHAPTSLFPHTSSLPGAQLHQWF